MSTAWAAMVLVVVLVAVAAVEDWPHFHFLVLSLLTVVEL
jgi:hypothetical protein